MLRLFPKEYTRLWSIQETSVRCAEVTYLSSFYFIAWTILSNAKLPGHPFICNCNVKTRILLEDASRAVKFNPITEA